MFYEDWRVWFRDILLLVASLSSFLSFALWFLVGSADKIPHFSTEYTRGLLFFALAGTHFLTSFRTSFFVFLLKYKFASFEYHLIAVGLILLFLGERKISNRKKVGFAFFKALLNEFQSWKHFFQHYCKGKLLCISIITVFDALWGTFSGSSAKPKIERVLRESVLDGGCCRRKGIIPPRGGRYRQMRRFLS